MNFQDFPWVFVPKQTVFTLQSDRNQSFIHIVCWHCTK